MANLTMAGTKDHPITIGPIAERVRVVWRGRTIGDSKHALELREANYPPVVYVPRADMDMSALKRTARVTTCPSVGVKVPHTSCSKVDLPLPLRPITPTVSPRSTCRFRSRSAQWREK